MVSVAVELVDALEEAVKGRPVSVRVVCSLYFFASFVFVYR